MDVPQCTHSHMGVSERVRRVMVGSGAPEGEGMRREVMVVSGLGEFHDLPRPVPLRVGGLKKASCCVMAESCCCIAAREMEGEEPTVAIGRWADRVGWGGKRRRGRGEREESGEAEASKRNEYRGTRLRYKVPRLG